MAYNSKLRPNQRVLNKVFYGKFPKLDGGVYDCSEGMVWKDFDEDMLIAFAVAHTKETVDRHLIGDVPVKKSSKKVSKAPAVDGKEEK